MFHSKMLVECIVVVGGGSVGETPEGRLRTVLHSYVDGWVIVLARCVSSS